MPQLSSRWASDGCPRTVLKFLACGKHQYLNLLVLLEASSGNRRTVDSSSSKDLAKGRGIIQNVPPFSKLNTSEDTILFKNLGPFLQVKFISRLCASLLQSEMHVLSKWDSLPSSVTSLDYWPEKHEAQKPPHKRSKSFLSKRLEKRLLAYADRKRQSAEQARQKVDSIQAQIQARREKWSKTLGTWEQSLEMAYLRQAAWAKGTDVEGWEQHRYWNL